jgi:uncharacterized membrane protein YdjX (TVP38/TMEM64 family)
VGILKQWLPRLAFPVFFAVLGFFMVFYHKEIGNLFENRDQLKTFILGAGLWAPLIFIGLQVLQVILAFIPGELTQLAGGWLFGTVLGTLYSLLGITLGSVFNFFVARVLGTQFVAFVAGKKNLERFESYVNTPRVFEILFILYLIPGMIKDVLAYVAGLSRIKLWGFLLISTVGRLPSLAVSSYLGQSFGEENWWGLAVAGVGVLAFLAVGWFLRERISAFLGRMVKNQPS